MCSVLAEQLDSATLTRLFPGFDEAGLRAILAGSPTKGRQNNTARENTQASLPHHAVQPGWHKLYSDGASRGNPGHAGAGALLIDDNGRELGRISQYLGECTNNAAEYLALLAGLNEASRLGCEKLALFLDSELVVRQLEGRYKVKQEQLVSLYQKARTMLSHFAAWTVKHVPRAENALADELANAGIDNRSQK